MDFPRFRLLGTRLRTAVVRLRLTDVLLFLLLLLLARHEWANRTSAGRYVKYPFGSGEVVVLDTSTGTLYGIDKDGAWRRNLVRAAIAAEEKAAKDAKAVKEAKEAEDAAAEETVEEAAETETAETAKAAKQWGEQHPQELAQYSAECEKVWPPPFLNDIKRVNPRLLRVWNKKLLGRWGRKRGETAITKVQDEIKSVKQLLASDAV